MTGIFEEPGYEDCINIKVAVVGRPGAGKSNLITTLCRAGTLSSKYIETIGVIVQHATFRLNEPHNGKNCVRYSFWEAGGRIAGKYSHMLPACYDAANLELHVFSLTDRLGFEELEKNIEVRSHSSPCIVAVGTRHDSVASWSVAPPELLSLSQSSQVTLCLVGNTADTKLVDNELPEFMAELYGMISKSVGIPQHELVLVK
mmetsp:Transcript_16084/g.22210  ORF Transcript_16084/g.22210 Transcript_16084/m.22210 type:complete len:202 (+) Transcript_16084:342-947(+)|eukprot:CAMPEP_0196586878 /NCGR_PEP_ID=MMETSP1081-20130531/55862_1 /TAXON_ID=36882 /ORGANISM="Pyramimonas amylifera, Strain CCMP720" /LENGTH=201 /DNA_ID=CAMNT_0041908893 /DNA_START=339 /DNA_END=947 /DNA_ORIENTATION=+